MDVVVDVTDMAAAVGGHRRDRGEGRRAGHNGEKRSYGFLLKT